ncbi:response regulator [Lederbergia wuyishanensis]|uniref:Two-component system response regulator YesN n=1 Tax=Lederbergia wuyishanensis TaxID=1347903 RepID=A0ABU0D721_9BACI|nr:response regulator transcription factor [Lederbergia wuyishanensis]MCJ8008836.1 response regulator transcription factor [Lederbergia wuyishanensis]MDQ0344158.1 two-component system response regulator YesN [Lederbergia wuyishanensis]
MDKQEHCKVLIVDDEVLIRQGIKHYINWEQEGFTIVGEASNGSEALQLIEQEQPHIVITDMVMPIMDGEKLTKEIKEHYPDIEVIILSSFSDFEYVRSTFQSGVADYILKPKLEGPELLKTLQRVVKNIPNFKLSRTDSTVNSIEDLIHHLMTGYEVNYDHQLVKEVFPKKYFCLIGADATEYDLNHSQIDSILNMLVDIACYPVLKEATGFTYLLNIEKSDLTTIINKLEDVTANVDWTLSEPFIALQDIKNQFQESLQTLRKYRFYFPNFTVLTYDQLPKLSDEQKKFDLNYFIDVFKKRDFEDAFEYLNDYVECLSRQYAKDENEFKSFLGNIIFNTTILLENLHFKSESLQQEKYHHFSMINDAKDVVETTKYFHSYLNEVKAIIHQEIKEPSQSNMQKLLDYIDQYYAEPISLSSLAEHFHFNPSYLSSYFSTHHSIGFNEYLTHIRIEKAKEYLQNQKISISEISGLVGYSDHSYFCKVFKKMTGMSPSKYRKSTSL